MLQVLLFLFAPDYLLYLAKPSHLCSLSVIEAFRLRLMKAEGGRMVKNLQDG